MSGLTIQPTFGLRWRPSEKAELVLDAQTVDNSGPGRQGRFVASRTVSGGGSGNFLQEVALAASVRLWHDPADMFRLTLGGSASRATRSYFARDTVTGETFGGNLRQVIPAVTLGASGHGRRGQGSLSLVSAFLSDNDALYLRRPPGETEKFGTVIGPEATVDVQIAPPLTLRARAFLPVSGNNTIRRSTGAPDRAIAYDAGFQLQLNPTLAAELFASNALGNTGALSWIPDREYQALGAGVRLRPGRIWPYDRLAPRALDVIEEQVETVHALAPLAEGGLTPGRIGARVRWSGQGVLAGAELTPVSALSVGAFLDLLNGRRDEGELGAVARLRLLGRRADSRIQTGAVVAASRTNNPLINLLAERWDQIDRLGLPKGGFTPGDESLEEGRLYVVAGAVPLTFRGSRTGVRVSPIVGYVQRNGLQISGVAGGIDQRVSRTVVVTLESGVALGKGNELTANGRKKSIPFAATAVWTPDARTYQIADAVISLDFFVTNRAGDSPFHLLRVRAGGEAVAGVGLRIGLP